MHSSHSGPRLQEYEKVIAELRSALDAAARRTRQLRAVLIILAGAVVLIFVMARRTSAQPWPLAVLLPGTALTAFRLRGADAALKKAFRLYDYYEIGIARLTRRWDILPPGDEYSDPTHLYAVDLDLFGRGSLYQLVCSARTRAGKDTLARWMKDPASIHEACERAAAVRELCDRLDIREALAAAGSSKLSDFRIETFEEWVRAAVKFPSWAPAVALFLASAVFCISITCLIQWSLQFLNNPYVVAVLALEAVFSLVFIRRVRAVLSSVTVPCTELPLLCEVIRAVEKHRFLAPKLVAVSERLRQGGVSASRELGRLLRLVTLLYQRDNPWVTMFSYLLLWGTQFAMAVNRWNRKHGSRMGPWLEAVGEFEALVSLATYASEHPLDCFAEFTYTGPLIEAKGIGHPLLEEATCVRNDLQLAESRRFAVVSGSNMSGKSTFLRAVALNVVLARMGAPVRCESLRLSDMRVGASIQVRDSLADGRSHFLAEMERLRRIIDAAERGHLLYVIDEILIGTNSCDRLVAAEWIIRALVAREAVGLVSTHDLALTNIVKISELNGANFHFTHTGDQVPLQFDYRLNEGVVACSSALSIVRSLGIDAANGLI